MWMWVGKIVDVEEMVGYEGWDKDALFICQSERLYLKQRV